MKKLLLLFFLSLFTTTLAHAIRVQSKRRTVADPEITFFWNPESNTAGQSADFPVSSTISFTTAGSSWVVTASSDAYLGTYSLDNRNGGSKRIHIPTMTPTGLSIINFAEGCIGFAYQIRENPVGMDGEFVYSTNTTGGRFLMGTKQGAGLSLAAQYVNLSTGIAETDTRIASGTWHYIVYRWDYDGDKLGIAGVKVEIDGVVALSSGGANGTIPLPMFDTNVNQYEIAFGGFDGNVIWMFLDAIRISSNPNKDLWTRRFSLTP